MIKYGLWIRSIRSGSDLKVNNIRQNTRSTLDACDSALYLGQCRLNEASDVCIGFVILR